MRSSYALEANLVKDDFRLEDEEGVPLNIIAEVNRRMPRLPDDMSPAGMLEERRFTIALLLSAQDTDELPDDETEW